MAGVVQADPVVVVSVRSLAVIHDDDSVTPGPSIVVAVDGKTGVRADHPIVDHNAIAIVQQHLAELDGHDLRVVAQHREQNRIIVNENMEMAVPGILAAGDIRSSSPGQVSTAIGDGATAAISAIRFLQETSNS